MPSYHLIPLLDIEVPPSRQRTSIDPDAIEELATSIASPCGLLHPLILRNDKTTLIAGERRLRAIDSLYAKQMTFTCGGEPIPPGFVPVLCLSDLTSAELAQTEYVENVLRVALTWQEQVTAEAAVAEALRKENPGMSNRDLARAMLSSSPNPSDKTEDRVHSLATTLPSHLALAENLNIPAVAKATSAKEAAKELVRHTKRQQAIQLAATAKPLDASSPHTFHQVDFREAPPLGPFVCIIADPPYGVNADSFKSGYEGAGAQHHYDDSWENAKQTYLDLFDRLPVFLLPNAHAYIFCDIRKWAFLEQLFYDSAAGQAGDFTLSPRPIIWYKGQKGIAPDPRFLPRNSYDAIMYIRRGNHEVLRVAEDCIVSAQQSSGFTDGGKLIMAEKPVELYINLLTRSCVPGQAVYDPTCGSGTIFKAAQIKNLRATGTDIDPLAAGLCLEYLNSLI